MNAFMRSILATSTCLASATSFADQKVVPRPHDDDVHSSILGETEHLIEIARSHGDVRNQINQTQRQLDGVLDGRTDYMCLKKMVFLARLREITGDFEQATAWFDKAVNLANENYHQDDWRRRDIIASRRMFELRRNATQQHRTLLDSVLRFVQQHEVPPLAEVQGAARRELQRRCEYLEQATTEVSEILGGTDNLYSALLSSELMEQSIPLAVTRDANSNNQSLGGRLIRLAQLESELGLHPYVAKRYCQLGQLFLARGSSNEAANCFKQANAVYEEVFGDEYFWTFFSKYLHAVSLSRNGQYGSAYDLMDRLFSRYEFSSRRVDLTNNWGYFLAICVLADHEKKAFEYQDAYFLSARQRFGDDVLAYVNHMISMARRQDTFGSFVLADRFKDEAMRRLLEGRVAQEQSIAAITSIAMALRQAGDYAKAIRVVKEHLNSVRNRQEDQYELYTELARSLELKNELPEAIECISIAIDIHRESSNYTKTRHQNHLLDLARCYRSIRMVAESRLALEEAIELVDRTEDSIMATRNLELLYVMIADLYCEERDFVAAGIWFSRMLEQEGAGAEETRRRLPGMFVQAGGRLLESEGRVLAGVDTLRHALSRQRELSPEPDEAIADIQLRLGVAYRTADNLPLARNALLQALDILRRQADPADPRITRALIELGGVYRALGDTAQAFSYVDRAVRRLGDGPPADDGPPLEERRDLAAAFYDLAAIHAGAGDTERARDCYRRSETLWNDVLGRQGLRTEGLLVRAAIAIHTGQLDQAVEDLQLALRRQKLRTRPFHPRTVETLALLGVAHAARGDDQAAGRHFREALDLERKSARRDRVVQIKCLDNLGMLALSRHDRPSARRFFERALEARIDRTDRLADLLSEAEILAHSQNNSLDVGRLLSALGDDREGHARAAYDWVLREESVVWLTLKRRRRHTRESRQVTRLLDELQLTKNQLSQLTFERSAGERSRVPMAEPSDARPAEDGPAAAGTSERQSRLTRLSRHKEELERRIAEILRRSHQADAPERLTAETLVRQLPPDVGIVHLARAHDWRAEQTGPLRLEPRYHAFVVRRPVADERSVRWLDLGPARAIDVAVGRWRQRIMAERPRGLRLVPRRDPSGGPDRAPDAEPPDVLFRRLTWDKIEPHLQGLATVVVVPDGALHRVPWTAIPDRRGNGYLLERLTIASVPKAEQVRALLTAEPPRGRNLLVVGGVSYDRRDPVLADPGPVDLGPTRRHRAPSRETADGPAQWSFLPGTRDEARGIQQLATRHATTRLIEGPGASESALRAEMSRFRYLHLATHGFFADPRFRTAFGHDLESERLAPGGFLMTGPLGTVTGRNPLLLSGLVFAGANDDASTDPNDPAEATDDGIMTAEEIIDLDLSATELVVLSGCETGLGEVAGGEGVYGLQRAFALAGARSVVASLWQVNDQATRALMIEFYKNLWDKRLPKAQALRQAQLAMLRGAIELDDDAGRSGETTRRDVSLWAGWMINGDWR